MSPSTSPPHRQGSGTRSRRFGGTLYGTGGDLVAKRVQRNPFNRQPPYEESCPELAGLLRHRGPDLFEGRLPW